ncbi:MAG TPA: hypothetical protein VGR28_02480 [Candidatus Thermoplasmatota archaeon]|jgi:hypothetical protein|nr:hypothetical protein [Candidatus Thermoplasmatota archaeon]
MRGVALAMVLGLLSLALAGCTTFSGTTTSTLPEVRASFTVRPYDSDGNGKTDGIALTLRSAQPPPPLVGSDAVIQRNGDDNVTVWRCAQRSIDLCQGNRGVLSWIADETVYIRGVAPTTRVNVIVRERFVYNTTVQVEENRDTEVWAVLRATPYDSDGNQTNDGLLLELVQTDKAPFLPGEVAVRLNQRDVTIFTDPRRTVEFQGNAQWRAGTKLYVDAFLGDNRVEVFLRATKYNLGTRLVDE